MRDLTRYELTVLRRIAGKEPHPGIDAKWFATIDALVKLGLIIDTPTIMITKLGLETQEEYE